MEEKEPEMNNVTRLADRKFNEQRTERRDRGSDGRPVIQLVQGELSAILDRADAVLGAADATIFRQSTRLIRVNGIEAGELGGIWRPDGAIVIQPVTAAHLVDRLALVANFEKFNARIKKWCPADVPRPLAESFLARAGEWRHIRPLHGIVETPTLGLDGSVIDNPGYDAASRIYFAGKVPAGYSSPPSSPTRTDAAEAVDFLRDIFWDFPFIAESDRSAAIACMLTSIVRRSLPAAPLSGITAAVAGTGKTKLADSIAIIATGRRAPVISLGEKHEETEKRLTAALLMGDPIILLDNIERPLYGDLLCQVLSQPSVNLRPLGGSAMTTVLTNCTFIATGNNLDVRGDLKRRLMLIRLDAGVERPELRRFSSDVLETVAQNRGQIILALLTIVRAYLAAGSPETEGDPFGGFEAWDAWCRRPLLWLDRPDPLVGSMEVRTEDPDIVLQREFFQVWHEVFGDEAVRVDQIIAQSISEDSSLDDQVPTQRELRERLHDALYSATGEKITTKRLGNWLKKHRGRIIDGRKIERSGNDGATKRALWKLIT